MDPNRKKLTVGGDGLNYPGDCGMPTANILLVIMLGNSLISTIGDKFMSGYIGNFYLDTLLKQYKYVHLRLEDILRKIVTE